jgi:hypothetical protein
MLQAHNLLNALDFLVLHNLVVARFADVEELAAKGKNTKVITSDDRETCYCQRLGGVTFREDEGAVLAIAGAGVVRVTELGHTTQTILLSVRPTTQSYDNQPRTFATVQRFHLFIGFEFGPVENIVDDRRLGD